MKKLLLFACLAIAGPVIQTGCQHEVVLESGGAYSDPVLATTDRAILDAARAMGDFVSWHAANAAYLAKWPEVGVLAAKVAAGRDEWVRTAYAARDAYAQASAAYRAGKQGAPDRAQLRAALAVLTNATTQISSYRSAHAN